MFSALMFAVDVSEAERQARRTFDGMRLAWRSASDEYSDGCSDRCKKLKIGHGEK
jgi:hypothetical protein